MDPRKLNVDITTTIHNEGSPEEVTELRDESGLTIAYSEPDTAEELVQRWNAYPELVKALQALELRCTQARIASGIGQPRLKDADFLRGECERIATDARAAIAKATQP